MFYPKIFSIVAKEVTYEQMSTEDLEQLQHDYENEKRSNEARNEWLTNECATLQSLLDERARDDNDED